MYRILVEVDQFGQPIDSVAIYDVDLNEVVEWVGSVDEAIEYVNSINGRLAVEN